jgi:hypothetical protein
MYFLSINSICYARAPWRGYILLATRTFAPVAIRATQEQRYDDFNVDLVLSVGMWNPARMEACGGGA